MQLVGTTGRPIDISVPAAEYAAVALDEPRCYKITALIAEQLLCVRTRDRRDHSL
jgi:hypothetical protein